MRYDGLATGTVRNRMSLAGHVPQPGAQPDQLVLGQARVGPDGGQRGVQEADQRPRVEQDVAAGGPVDHRGEEALLALDPTQVGAGVEAAGPDVGEAGLAVDVADAGRQPQAGLAVAQPDRAAHVDAADRVDQPDEAEEVDLEVVVDADAGGALDGGDRQRPARRRRRPR